MRHHHTQFCGKFVMMTTRTCQPAEQLLSLMTGAWHTQAIAVAANMGLADHLAQNVSTKELAERLDADHQALRRLLRYLASIGILRTVGQRYELTSPDTPLPMGSAASDRLGWLAGCETAACADRPTSPPVPSPRPRHKRWCCPGKNSLPASSPSWPPPS